MWEDFKKFVVRGNVMDMAVGIVVGAAFTSIVKAFVDHLLMPPLGVLTGGVDFSQHYVTLKAPTGAGPFATPDDMVKAGAVLVRYGLLINAVITFMIVAFVVFLLMRGVNKLTEKPPADPTTKDCPRCFSSIPVKATRCGHCTSELGTAAAT